MHLLACAFRPFFPLAGLIAGTTVLITVLALTGHVTLPVEPMGWHAHEMLFGFTGALLAGFFLTATPNWTKRPFMRGAPLGAVVALWIAGRVVMLLGPAVPFWLKVIVDVAFFAVLAVLIGWPVYAARSTRNYGFPVFLMGLSAANLWEHLVQAGQVEYTRTPRQLAATLVLCIIVVFAGRVVPMFTRNALRRARVAAGKDPLADPVRQPNLIDKVAVYVTALVPLSLLTGEPKIYGAICAVAAIVNFARFVGWGVLHTFRLPIVWILHIAYLWIPVALGLEALAHLRPGSIGLSLSLHALTAGVLGTFAMGMMTRVIRGHTGRPLQVPALIGVAYVALTAAALVRVFLPMFKPAATIGAWHAASGLWALAFMLFVVIDLPKSLKARADGKPG